MCLAFAVSGALPMATLRPREKNDAAGGRKTMHRATATKHSDIVKYCAVALDVEHHSKARRTAFRRVEH